MAYGTEGLVKDNPDSFTSSGTQGPYVQKADTMGLLN